MLLGQSVSGKLTEILVRLVSPTILGLTHGGPETGFFLRKYFLAIRRFGKKPAFFGGSACRTKSIILTKNLHKLAPTQRNILAVNSRDIISDERFVVCGSFH